MKPLLCQRDFVMKKTKLILIMLISIAALIAMPCAAFAEEGPEAGPDVPAAVESQTITEDLDPGNSDELYEQYIDRLFYGEQTPPSGAKKRAKKSAGSALTGMEQTIYSYLKPVLADIAAGNRDSARIEVPLSVLGMDGSFTAEDLGVDYLWSKGEFHPGVSDAVEALFDYDAHLIFQALYADCPYELYWYDGSVSYSSFPGYSGEYENGQQCLRFSSGLKFSFSVEAKYRADSSDPYSVDTEATGAGTEAVNNSQTILDEAAGMDDYSKLCHYKDRICGLVEYNEEAAAAYMEDENAEVDKGAWALVYVFDGDLNTNVVCEGYSEAFQYLCDRTEFSDDLIYAFSATGDMNDGPHKWNLVHMHDEKTYIADITNSDEGTIGQNGELFLSGMNGSFSAGYSKKIAGRTITYRYDEDTTAVYDEADLTLSDTPFVYETEHSYGDWIVIQPAGCEENGNKKKVCSSCGDVEYEAIKAAGHDWGGWTEADANQHQRVCANNSEHVEKAAHNWDAGVVTQEASCTQAGVKVHNCETCGAVKEEPIKALGHSLDAGTVTKAATCTAAGTKVYKCTTCGATVKTETIKALGHSLDAGTVTRAATCAAPGVKTYKCKRCGAAVKTETIKALAHSSDAGMVTKAATCTQAGVKTYKCKKCGKVLKTESIKALGHTWDKGRVTKAATTQAPGVRTFTCTRCGAKRTASIAKLPVTELIDLGVTVKLSSVKKAKNSFKAKWKKPKKKNLRLIDGYQIQYSRAANFAGAKTIPLAKSKKSIKIKGLGPKTKYFVRIRTYKKAGRITHYSRWSPVKSVITK